MVNYGYSLFNANWIFEYDNFQRISNNDSPEQNEEINRDLRRYGIYDLSYKFFHLTNKLADILIRKNKKELLDNQIVIPKPTFVTTFLDQSNIERAIYESALGDKMKMIELCNHILVSEQHVNILGNKPLTLEEIHEKMTQYYFKKIEKLKITKNNIEDILSKNITLRKREEYLEKQADVNERLETVTAKYNIFNSINEKIEENNFCPICYEEFSSEELSCSVTPCGHFYIIV